MTQKETIERRNIGSSASEKRLRHCCLLYRNFFVSFKAKTLERRARLLTNFQSLGTRPKVSAAAASPRKNLIEMRASLFTRKEVPRRFDIPN